MPPPTLAKPSTLQTQNNHRKTLVQAWSILPGSRVLEIGCGQGDCTEALAEAVGPAGHIDAIDPAPLDYGSPETLGEAQSRISQSPVGSRITWHQASPVEFLSSVEDGTYNAAVLCHSIWYFASPAEVRDTLHALRRKALNLCIAEYALHASEPTALPHVLAALARAALEAHTTVSTENIRTALDPAAIRQMANEAGWRPEHIGTIVPEEGLEDGKWETGSVLKSDFLEGIQTNVKDDKVRVVLRSMREAVRGAVETLDGKDIRTMDVWVGKF
jgi:ubiquinone/menaquinone biosynthesis C-methylase UbiE